MLSSVTQPVSQRIAATLWGLSRHHVAREPSAQSTSPPPDQSHGIQRNARRSNAVPHWSTRPSPSVSRVSTRATRRNSSHVQSLVGYGRPARSNKSLL